MKLLCQIETQINTKERQAVISVLEGEKKLCYEICNVKDLCEGLPSMFANITKCVDKNEIESIILDFDIDKNLTTKRVLMSFLFGFFSNNINIVER